MLGKNAADFDPFNKSEGHLRFGNRLIVKVRMNIMSISNIDTLNQQFDCGFFMIVETTNAHELEVINNELTVDNFDPRIRFLNLTNTKVWRMRVRRKTRDGNVQFRCKYEIYATFSDEMMLQKFPFDVQSLKLLLSSVIPIEHLLLTCSSKKPVVLQKTGFGAKNVFEMHETVFVRVGNTEKKQSTHGIERPLMHIGVRMRRRPEFFIWNFVVPMQFITATAFFAFFIKADADGTSDRVANCLTILLTAVAFKLMVANSLPNVSYLTTADYYLLQSFSFIALVATHSAFAATLNAEVHEKYDSYVAWIFVGLFVVHTIGWILKIWYEVRDSARRVKHPSYEMKCLVQAGGHIEDNPTSSVSPHNLSRLQLANRQSSVSGYSQLDEAKVPSKKKKVLLVSGPPGCGKGTQAGKLATKFGLAHLSTGNLLRAAVQSGSALGQKAKDAMEKGHLVEDEIMIELIKTEIADKSCDSGFILDGFPRTAVQAEKLTNMLTSVGSKVTGVLNFQVPDEVLSERICGRWTHAPSGRSYHTKFCPPKQAGLDDVTGEPLSQRDDDNEETLKKRLATFHEKTTPVFAYYSQAGLLARIDANQPPEDVFSKAVSAIELQMANS